MIVIGTRFFTRISRREPQPSRCGECGAVAPFILKQGLRCITLFFIIPVLPISGMKYLAQCPNCGTRYDRPRPA